ncbi:T7SS effector LXG polymorphic toxin [Bacillus sp. FSL W7-1360]
MKVLDVKAVIGVFDTIKRRLKDADTTLEMCEHKIHRFVRVSGFEGAGAEAMRNHSKYVDVPTLHAFRQYIAHETKVIEKCKQNIRSFESENALVREDFWRIEVPRGINKLEASTENIVSNVNKIAASISDIANIGKLDITDFKNAAGEERKHANSVVHKLDSLDRTNANMLRSTRPQLNKVGAMSKKAAEFSTGNVLSYANINAAKKYFEEQGLNADTIVADKLKELKPGAEMYAHAFPFDYNYNARPTSFMAIKDYDDYQLYYNVSSALPLTSYYNGLQMSYGAHMGAVADVKEGRPVDVSKASSAYEASHMVNQPKGQTKYHSDEWGKSTSQFEWSWSLDDTSMAADFTPIVANIKSGIEAFTGRDPITGRKLEPWERSLAMAAIIGGPAVKGVSRVAKGAKNADKVGDVSSKIPQNGTLSALESRKWYLDQEKAIPSRIDPNAPLEQQARQSFALRNSARTKARDLMEDRELAKKITAENPNLTWEQVLSKAKNNLIDQGNKNFTLEDVFTEIIGSSQRSRKSVNERFKL